MPSTYSPVGGQGVSIASGSDAVIFAYGPIMLTLAFEAANTVRDTDGVAVKVVNLPWLNIIDPDWLLEEISDGGAVFSLDNHFHIGGQGDRIADIMAENPHSKSKLVRISLEEIPSCGTNEEILVRHGFNIDALVKRIKEGLVKK